MVYPVNTLEKQMINSMNNISLSVKTTGKHCINLLQRHQISSSQTSREPNSFSFGFSVFVISEFT